MAPCDMKVRRRLRSMDLLKLALIVITFSGVYLFMMVHRIENPFMRADLSLPINFEPDLQWNDSFIGGMGKTEEISDHLENDNTFNDLFNFHKDSTKENTSSSQHSFQRKSNFRKRRNLSKSRRISKMRSELNRRETSDSRNLSISKQKLAPTASRRFSDDHRKSVESKVAHRQSFESQSDPERQPETTNSSRRFNNDHPTNLGKELFKIGSREKEQQSESLHLSNDDMKQSEPLYLPNDELKPKQTKRQELDFPETHAESHQQKKHKIPSSSHVNNSKSSRNFTTSDGIDGGKLEEKFNDRSPADNRTVYSKDEPFPDASIKGSIAKSKFSNTQDFALNQLQKASSNLGQHSSKAASNDQDNWPPKSLNNMQDSEPLPKTSSGKRISLLIFGDDRSGTTFVTKMFAADPQMFTVYEPLWVTKKWFSQLKLVDYYKKVKLTVDVVNALLSCQFTRSKAGKTFLGYTSESWVGPRVFEKNVFRTAPFANKTKSGKRTWPNLYRKPEFAEQVCLNQFNHSVVKVGQIRVPGESLSVFIPRVFRENPDTDIRVLQIVRDPRGSINSRIRAGWISDFTYTEFPKLAEKLCAKIESNIEFGRSLKTEWLKERYMEINYREITTMPITTAKKIYKFAGFEMPDSLIDWIVKSTNPEQDQLQQALTNPYSHVRDSSKNNLKWRRESPIKRVRIIEKQCKSLLDLLGLDAVADEMEILCS
ncbi:uncharacterized protein LOC144641357 [Oculina patagonica]